MNSKQRRKLVREVQRGMDQMELSEAIHVDYGMAKMIACIASRDLWESRGGSLMSDKSQDRVGWSRRGRQLVFMMARINGKKGAKL